MLLDFTKYIQAYDAIDFTKHVYNKYNECIAAVTVHFTKKQ